MIRIHPAGIGHGIKRSFVKCRAACLALMAVILVAGAACGGGGDNAPPVGIQVVTTTALLADLVRNVGGERVSVRSLAPPGSDVHSFQSTPGDSLAISRAAVLVSNGSGLDDFLDPVLRNAAREDVVWVVASKGLAGTIDGEVDPHFFQDPLMTVDYVERIRDGLIQADKAGEDGYRANGRAYIQILKDLNQEIENILLQVPVERRHIFTFHDAFGHFARRYGWQVTAFVPSDAGDVTPGSVVDVLEKAEALGIPAFFAEPQLQTDLLKQAAGDAGVSVGTIYSDIAKTNATSYLEMIRFNAASLVEHLR